MGQRLGLPEDRSWSATLAQRPAQGWSRIMWVVCARDPERPTWRGEHGGREGRRAWGRTGATLRWCRVQIVSHRSSSVTSPPILLRRNRRGLLCDGFCHFSRPFPTFPLVCSIPATQPCTRAEQLGTVQGVARDRPPVSPTRHLGCQGVLCDSGSQGSVCPLFALYHDLEPSAGTVC